MKKLLSLVLAAAMAVGTCVGFAGCDFGGNNNSNSGDNGGESNPGGNTPGTVTTDTKTELLTNIVNADYRYITMDVNANVASKTGYDDFSGTVTIGAKIDLSDITAPAIDALVHGSSAESNMYDILLMRGGYVYTTEGAWDDVEGVQAGDFNALFNAYRTSDSLAFERNSIGGNADVAPSDPAGLSGVATTAAQAVPGGQISDLPVLPLVIRLAGNLADVLGCEVKTTSSGYSIDFDIVKAANEIANGLYSILDTASADTKVNDIIANAYVTKTLSTLLKGISAQEVLGMLQTMSSDFATIMTILPAPGSQSLFDYLKSVLNDTRLYATLSYGLSESGFALPATATCFGELTLKNIVDLVASIGVKTEISSGDAADEEIAEDEPADGAITEEQINAVIEMIKDIVKKQKDDLVGTIAGLIQGGEGEGSVDKIAVSLLFDSSKKFTGIDATVSNLKAKVTTEYSVNSGEGTPDSSAAEETVTETAEIGISGSASVRLVSSLSLTSLQGLKYKTDGQSSAELEPSHHTYDKEFTFHLAKGTSIKEVVDVTVPVTYELTVTGDEVSVTVSIPDFKIKNGDNYTPIENKSGSLSLSAIKNATSERPASTLISGSASNTVIFYENVMYVCTISLRGYAWEEGVAIELCYGSGGLKTWDQWSVYYRPELAPIA